MVADLTLDDIRLLPPQENREITRCVSPLAWHSDPHDHVQNNANGPLLPYLSLTLSQTNMFPIASVHKRHKQNYKHVLPSLLTAQGANIINDSGSAGRSGVGRSILWEAHQSGQWAARPPSHSVPLHVVMVVTAQPCESLRECAGGTDRTKLPLGRTKLKSTKHDANSASCCPDKGVHTHPAKAQAVAPPPCPVHV